MISRHKNRYAYLCVIKFVVINSTVEPRIASSIVAGKEPEHTNKLLQIIGKCILEKKTSDEAVEKLKNKSKSKKTEENVIEEKPEKANKKDRKSSKDSLKEQEKGEFVYPFIFQDLKYLFKMVIDGIEKNEVNQNQESPIKLKRATNVNAALIGIVVVRMNDAGPAEKDLARTADLQSKRKIKK